MEPCSINLHLISSNENHSEINNFCFLLVSMLRNDKHAHCLVKNFWALINVEQGAICKGYQMITSKKKKNQTPILMEVYFCTTYHKQFERQKKKDLYE
jgi:hypothetical protein